MKYLYADGFTLGGNPSPKGGGYRVANECANVIAEQTYLRPGFTNNEGELRGALEALIMAEPGDKVVIDSQVILYWIKAGKSKARPDLNHLCEEAKELSETKNVEVLWQPRKENLAGWANDREKNRRKRRQGYSRRLDPWDKYNV